MTPASRPRTPGSRPLSPMLELVATSSLATAKLKSQLKPNIYRQHTVDRLESKLDAMLARDPKLGRRPRPKSGDGTKRKKVEPFSRSEAFDAVTALFDGRLHLITDAFAPRLPDLAAFVKRQFKATYRSDHVVDGKLRRFAAALDAVPPPAPPPPVDTKRPPSPGQPLVKEEKKADVVAERLLLFSRVLKSRNSLSCFDALTVVLTELGGGVEPLLQLSPAVGRVLIPVGGGTVVCWLPQEANADADAPPRVAALGAQCGALLDACRALVVHGLCAPGALLALLTEVQVVDGPDALDAALFAPEPEPEPEPETVELLDEESTATTPATSVELQSSQSSYTGDDGGSVGGSVASGGSAAGGSNAGGSRAPSEGSASPAKPAAPPEDRAAPPPEDPRGRAPSRGRTPSPSRAARTPSPGFRDPRTPSRGSAPRTESRASAGSGWTGVREPDEHLPPHLLRLGARRGGLCVELHWVLHALCALYEEVADLSSPSCGDALFPRAPPPPAAAPAPAAARAAAPAPAEATPDKSARRRSTVAERKAAALALQARMDDEEGKESWERSELRGVGDGFRDPDDDARPAPAPAPPPAPPPPKPVDDGPDVFACAKRLLKSSDGTDLSFEEMRAMTFVLRRRRLLTANCALPTGRLVTIRYTADETVASAQARLHDLLGLDAVERSRAVLLAPTSAPLPLADKLSSHTEHNNATLKLVSADLLDAALPPLPRPAAPRAAPHMSYTRMLRSRTDGIIRGDLGKDLNNRWGPTRLRPMKLRPRRRADRDRGRDINQGDRYANRKYNYVSSFRGHRGPSTADGVLL